MLDQIPLEILVEIQVLVTEQNKNLWKMITFYFKMSFRRKLVKPQFLHWPISHEKIIIDHLDIYFLKAQ